jgi:hypothetical protein
LGIISEGFNVADQLLIRYFAFARHIGEKMEHNETVHQLFKDFKKDYNSLRREVLYNIVIEFG